VASGAEEVVDEELGRLDAVRDSDHPVVDPRCPVVEVR
jgi:hypothetical protein